MIPQKIQEVYLCKANNIKDYYKSQERNLRFFLQMYIYKEGLYLSNH